MKKCPRCIVFYSKEERTRCIFCNGGLQHLTIDELNHMRAAQVEREALVRATAQRSSLVDHDHMSPFLATYYQTLSFKESYRFCRHQMIKGRTFPRLFVQPLSVMFLIKIPWFVINCLDSIFLRVFYSAYCDQCGCKYLPVTGLSKHRVDVCHYMIDYQEVLNRIFLGEIFIVEPALSLTSPTSSGRGARSAYADLIERRQGRNNLEDFFVMLVSVGIIFMIFSMLVMPVIRHFYYYWYM